MRGAPKRTKVRVCAKRRPISLSKCQKISKKVAKKGRMNVTYASVRMKMNLRGKTTKFAHKTNGKKSKRKKSSKKTVKRDGRPKSSDVELLH
jgi:hypothetical protein